MSEEQPTLTVIALARNEAEHLSSCFKSLQTLISLTQAETLVLLDEDADAATAQVAHRVAGRVGISRFVSFSAQRNRALELANTEWIFFIDADERCTESLAREIARDLRRDDCSAFQLPRRNILFGHEVRYAGWWPDYQIRLLRRAHVRYDESRQVHEYPTVDGTVCTLLNPLVHFNYESWRQFIEKQRAYAPLEARALYEAGHRARLRSYIGQPLREFKRRFVDYRGYRDGLLGFALSAAMSIYRAETYRQLRRIQSARSE
jgi:glycosyltransferase involved in cell wall biosynthesis